MNISYILKKIKIMKMTTLNQNIFKKYTLRINPLDQLKN